MLLEKATSEFRIAGQPYEGFPILLWDDMTGCSPANEFFHHYLLRSSITSTRSWESTGRALYDFFCFLKAHDLEWDSTALPGQKDLLAGYRDYCLRTIGLKQNTVRQRLAYLIAFYEFALSRRWIKHLPFTYEMRRMPRQGSMPLAHVAIPTTVLRPDVLPQAETCLPRFLTRDEVRKLLKAASLNPHHRMLIQFAVQSGLRRAELATFPISSVVDPHGLASRNIQIKLDPRGGECQKTKGGRARSVWIARELMADLHQYVKHHRGQRAGSSSREYPNLFLNADGEPFADDGKAISRIVKDIGARAGISVHTHLLRHTYATHQLVALQRNQRTNGLEPLVFIQRQLGHSSIATTLIYLHIVNELADDAVLQYDDELSMWAKVT